MAKNVHESSVSPPSPIPAISTEPNVPNPQEPKEKMEPEPKVVADVNNNEGSEPGSKNEPKPTMEVPIPSSTDDEVQEREDFPKPIILIVPAGMDIINTILNFARERDVSILVHHASGGISEVHISNPLSPSKDYTFQGNLHMFYLSGVYTKCLSPSPPKNTPFSFFNIQFSRGEVPEVYGGLVGDKLIASESVQITASLFKEHEYYEYREMLCPIPNPKVEADDADADADAESDDLDDTNINPFYHSRFPIRARGSYPSPMVALPFAAPPPPLDFSMLYRNNPTNRRRNY